MGKTECFMQGTRDYIKYLKEAMEEFHKLTHLTLRKEKNFRKVKREKSLYDGKPHSLKIF